jgi:hypothetical protein
MASFSTKKKKSDARPEALAEFHRGDPRPYVQFPSQCYCIHIVVFSLCTLISAYNRFVATAPVEPVASARARARARATPASIKKGERHKEGRAAVRLHGAAAKTSFKQHLTQAVGDTIDLTADSPMAAEEEEPMGNFSAGVPQLIFSMASSSTKKRSEPRPETRVEFHRWCRVASASTKKAERHKEGRAAIWLHGAAAKTSFKQHHTPAVADTIDLTADSPMAAHRILSCRRAAGRPYSRHCRPRRRHASVSGPCRFTADTPPAANEDEEPPLNFDNFPEVPDTLDFLLGGSGDPRLRG